MLTFVNGRPVDSRALNYALIEACQGSLPLGRFPQAYLFLDCDPAAVDVNVHPAKREVRFRNEAAVRAFVITGVRRALGRAEGKMPAPAPGWSQAVHEPPPPLQPFPAAAAAFPAQAPGTRPPPAERSGGSGATPAWRFVGLLRGGLALFETAAGLVILDRRAAHERVWFERLEAQFLSGGVPSQRLLLPAPLELDPIAAALLADRREFLRGHGFELAEFGRNFFRIEAIPSWMQPEDAEAFLREVLGAMRDGSFPVKDPVLARANLARMAASRAVRLPASPGEIEILSLAASLFETRSPLTSPSGRPTFLEIGEAELARRFQK
jgi:DNA mismatch repair protein MutL